jgi:hypothetical protein
MVPVKFDDGVSISFPGKEQIFKKKGGQKCTFSKKVPIFKNISSPAIWKMDRGHLRKSYIFFASHFSPEWDRQPAFKLNMDICASHLSIYA